MSFGVLCSVVGLVVVVLCVYMSLFCFVAVGPVVQDSDMMPEKLKRRSLIKTARSKDPDKSSNKRAKQNPRTEITGQSFCLERQHDAVHLDTQVGISGTMAKGRPTEKHLQPSAGGAKYDEVLSLSPW